MFQRCLGEIEGTDH